jgi:hypothetical protein
MTVADTSLTPSVPLLPSDGYSQNKGATLSPLQVLSKMAEAAAKGDTTALVSWHIYAEQNLLVKDYKEIQALMDKASPLELGSEGLKSILNNLLAKGGVVELGVEGSNIRKFLVEAIRVSNGSEPESVKKMMRGDKLSTKEIQEVFNWVSDKALVVVPPQNTMASLSAKLNTLRAAESQKKQQGIEFTENMNRVPS